MAAPWLIVLQAVPGGGGVKATPVVVEGAEKLWKTLRKKPDHISRAANLKDTDIPVSSVEVQLEQQAQDFAELRGVMASTSELIKALADQNAKLVARLEQMRRYHVVGWLAIGLSTLSLILVLKQG
jgi:hypothetical protein